MFIKSFKSLTKFELLLWLSSSVTVIASGIFSEGGIVSAMGSFIGVTALIFVAKGMVIGQVLTVVFSAFYGFISLSFGYYGEVITYMGMTAPIAVLAIVSWIRHPYKQSNEVAVARLTRVNAVGLSVATVIVTVLFYFVLKSLNTTNLLVSTISVTTSFSASVLTFFRSPYYAIAYALNDLVLIVMWVFATLNTIGYLPMIFCFVMFLLNDLYGFFNWKRIQKRQE